MWCGGAAGAVAGGAGGGDAGTSSRAAPAANIGALIIKIGFRGILYNTYNKEPSK